MPAGGLGLGPSFVGTDSPTPPTSCFSSSGSAPWSPWAPGGHGSWPDRPSPPSRLWSCRWSPSRSSLSCRMVLPPRFGSRAAGGAGHAHGVHTGFRCRPPGNAPPSSGAEPRRPAIISGADARRGEAGSVRGGAAAVGRGDRSGGPISSKQTSSLGSASCPSRAHSASRGSFRRLRYDDPPLWLGFFLTMMSMSSTVVPPPQTFISSPGVSSRESSGLREVTDPGLIGLRRLRVFRRVAGRHVGPRSRSRRVLPPRFGSRARGRGPATCTVFSRVAICARPGPPGTGAPSCCRGSPATGDHPCAPRSQRRSFGRRKAPQPGPDFLLGTGSDTPRARRAAPLRDRDEFRRLVADLFDPVFPAEVRPLNSGGRRIARMRRQPPLIPWATSEWSVPLPPASLETVRGDHDCAVLASFRLS